jgi:hypothetical protein
VRIVGAIGAELAARVAVAAKFQTLEDVVRWSGEVVDVVVQDEYTHDVIVRGPDHAFVVFDST